MSRRKIELEEEIKIIENELLELKSRHSNNPFKKVKINSEINKKEKESLGDFLDRAVFCGDTGEKVNPDKDDVVGFNEFIRRYVNGFEVEAAAVKSI